MPTRGFINVVSTKRSGHHAFVYWLMGGLPGTVYFENNLRLTDDLGDRVQALARRDEDALILNTEGVTPAGVARLVGTQRATGLPVRSIIFLRDPLNFAASLLHRKRFRRLEIVMITRQLVAERDWLQVWAEAGSAPQFAGSELDLVFYNPWLTDVGYRAGIADTYGLDDGEPLGEISPHGGGSSYGDIEHGGDAEAARRLLHRWQTARDDAVFQALVAHPAFQPWYGRHLAGDIVDSFGMHDGDTERLAFHESIREVTSKQWLLNRAVSNLAGDGALYQRIESTRGKRRKRLIARATVAAFHRSPKNA